MSDALAIAPSLSRFSKVDDWVGDFSREGWITRAGKFIPCDFEWGHAEAAMCALGGSVKDAELRAEKLGWLRISTYGEHISKSLSQAQQNTFFDWANAMGFDYQDALASITYF